MKGWKTYISSGLMIVWAGIGPFKLVDQQIWQSVALGLLGICFITLREGLRVSWSGAYKVYVDRNKNNAVVTMVGKKQ